MAAGISYIGEFLRKGVRSYVSNTGPIGSGVCVCGGGVFSPDESAPCARNLCRTSFLDVIETLYLIGRVRWVIPYSVIDSHIALPLI